MPEVIEKIGNVLDQKPFAINDTDRDGILSNFISSLDGDFAVTRIMDCVDNEVPNGGAPLLKRAIGSAYSRGRRWIKELKTTEGAGRHSVGFKQQRFPDVTVQVLRDKSEELARLGGLTGQFDVENVLPDVFRVRAL